MLLPRLVHRRRSARVSWTLSSWARVVLPALVGIAAAAWLRSRRAERPMPRLPLRRQPPRPRAAGSTHPKRLERLQAQAPEVSLPLSFWDAEVTEDDPAEIPSAGLWCVSEASQSAALLDPSEREESGLSLNW